jgi:hypothetical protein
MSKRNLERRVRALSFIIESDGIVKYWALDYFAHFFKVANCDLDLDIPKWNIKCHALLYNTQLEVTICDFKIAPLCSVKA